MDHEAPKTAVVRALSPLMTRSFVATPRGACIAVQLWDQVVALFWPVLVLSGASVCAYTLNASGVNTSGGVNASRGVNTSGVNTSGVNASGVSVKDCPFQPKKSN